MKRCSKRAFTLAELIVVLVILAILAAILIPALTGYIKRARTEKDMQMAATLREASQAALTEMYGRGEIPALNHKKENCSNSNAGSYTWNWEYANRVGELAGLPAGTRTSESTKYTWPYVFIIQVGRMKTYGNGPESYTVYRVFYQQTADSEPLVMDGNGIYYAKDSTSPLVSNKYGNIDAVCYGISWGNGEYNRPEAAINAFDSAT